MTEQPRTKTQITDPTGRAVAVNIRRLRDLRGLSTYDLSAKLKAAGRPIAPSAIAKVERAERRVDVGDMAAFAVALGVSPAALLVPLTSSGEDEVEVTGAGAVAAADAWAWASSRRPLRLSEQGASTELLEYQLYGLPAWTRELWTHLRQIDELTGLPPRRVGAVLDGLLEELERDREAGQDG
ncbi:helix-turn-helix domain-containing protein [Streptomyces sp. NPDC088915]|uniref:helix-turn-helix domain-containing protein n=1 Tax=Streptomyces sp. NPDC088915 TaxID=3365912 RepID=UPI0037F8D2AD